VTFAASFVVTERIVLRATAWALPRGVLRRASTAGVEEEGEEEAEELKDEAREGSDWERFSVEELVVRRVKSTEGSRDAIVVFRRRSRFLGRCFRIRVGYCVSVRFLLLWSVAEGSLWCVVRVDDAVASELTSWCAAFVGGRFGEVLCTARMMRFTSFY